MLKTIYFKYDPTPPLRDFQARMKRAADEGVWRVPPSTPPLTLRIEFEFETMRGAALERTHQHTEVFYDVRDEGDHLVFVSNLRASRLTSAALRVPALMAAQAPVRLWERSPRGWHVWGRENVDVLPEDALPSEGIIALDAPIESYLEILI